MTNETKEVEKAIEGDFKEDKPNGELVPVVPPSNELAIIKDPGLVIEEAQKVASAVTKVLKAKPKPVIIRGEHYLEIADWGFVAQCYGATAFTEWTRRAEGFDGWEARALVIDMRSGETIGAAEAMCTADEEEWGERPEYKWFDEGKVPEELKAAIVDKMPSRWGKGMRYKVLVGHEKVSDAARRSMAQTRAASRALAQRFRWVVALAGYKGTPAEEMPRSKYDSGNDYEPGDVVETANAQADQRKRTPMTDSDKTLIQTAVRLLIEQAKTGDPVAAAMQTAWTAWLTGKQGPGHGQPAENTKAVYDALFADDAFTYAAKKILGLKADAPTPAEPKGFDPDDETAAQRAQGEGPVGARPMHPTPPPAPEAARPAVSGANAWPADEQKFIRDTYNGIVKLKKDKQQPKANQDRAEQVFTGFAVWMNANTLNWTGDRGYTSLWSRYDLRDKVWELLELGAPPAPIVPGFDPNEEAV